MSPSFDWAVSTLLCTEDSNEFLDDDFVENDEPVETSFTDSSLDHMTPQPNQSLDQTFHRWKSLAEVLCDRNDECLDSMISKESQHLPESDYLARLQMQGGGVDLCGRMNAVFWIKKVHTYFGFGPLSLYLSVNYLDRFLSVNELPEGKAWMMQLLAVACVSIAAKMEETEIPLTQDFQIAESEFVFEARTIQKMEILVMSTLRWRMHPVTPFSFLESFLYKLNGDQDPSDTWLDKSVQLILCTVEDIAYLEFRPSEIAAAVAISVTINNQTQDDFQSAINLLGLVGSKERVVKVIELLHDLVLMISFSSRSSVQSPKVLDTTLMSNKSDTTTTDIDSCANSSTNIGDNKRRKVDSSHEVEQ